MMKSAAEMFKRTGGLTQIKVHLSFLPQIAVIIEKGNRMSGIFSMRNLSDSCDLTSGMARRLGRDIPGTVHDDPEMVATAYRRAVLLCSSCAEQQACKALQAECKTLDAAPAYCRNDWT